MKEFIIIMFLLATLGGQLERNYLEFQSITPIKTFKECMIEKEFLELNIHFKMSLNNYSNVEIHSICIETIRPPEDGFYIEIQSPKNIR